MLRTKILSFLIGGFTLLLTGFSSLHAEENTSSYDFGPGFYPFERSVTHPAMRRLPTGFDRPREANGPEYFVCATHGSDRNDGSKSSPWRSLFHSFRQLKPGDTLYLREGIFWEPALIELEGTEEAPITIRAFPNELVIINAGLRDFFENPQRAWEPFPEGADGEWVSTRTYPQFQRVNQDEGGRGIRAIFADSMIPLHRYIYYHDLQADPYEYDGHPKDDEAAHYSGPGLAFREETGRIHIRMKHTHMEDASSWNYTGETDPRNIPLIVGLGANAMHFQDARHVRIMDLVVTGSQGNSLLIQRSEHIHLDGVQVYINGHIDNSSHITILNSALRGVSAPWSSRASEKYRSGQPYLFTTRGEVSHVEIAYSEFTDSHDGVIVGRIDQLKFHHNRVDNMNDDGLYISSGRQSGENIHIYRNWVSRCLSSLAFAGSPAGQPPIFIYRNLFDLREPTNGSWTQMGPNGRPSRLVGDHGSPIWRPIYFYQNTVITSQSPWRSYYGAVATRSMRETYRRLFNNIFYHTDGMPGNNFLFAEEADLIVDANLHWSPNSANFEGDWIANMRLQRSRRPEWFEASKERYSPGNTAHDVFADPVLRSVPHDFHKPVDIRLDSESPARGAGLPLDPDPYVDPFRKSTPPDIGALPYSSEPWSVGIHGRLRTNTVDRISDWQD